MNKTAQGIDDQRFRVFIESVRDYALLMLDVDGRVVTWNLGAQSIKGYAAEEIIGQHFSVFYPPESVAAGLPAHELVEAARTGRYEDEGWRLRKDGSRFWANVVITALRGDDGKLLGYAKVTRDLTERRRHEEQLRASEARFRILIEGVRDYAIFMLDPGGYVASWNAGAEAIKGYRAEEIIGQHFSKFYPEETIQRGLPKLELVVATKEGRYEDEGWRIRKDGTRIWANVVITALRDPAGKLLGFSKVTRDLSERRRHEEKLRISEARFRALIEGVQDYAILNITSEGVITTWNSGAQQMTGFKAADAVGRHFSLLFTPEDIAAHRPWQQLAAVRESGRVAEEGWRARKDGTQYWSNNVLALLRDADGHAGSLYLVSQDLTQRRHAESLANTAQRMHEFIAMLAHELRNPLAPIRNAVNIMARKKIADPDLEAMRLIIDRQSSQLGRIVDELLDANRVTRGEFSINSQHLDLREVLSHAIESSRPLIDSHEQKLHLSIPDEPIGLQGDLMRLTQVFVNILNNASKYTPNAGQIWLDVRTTDVGIEVSVRDNGKGIDPDELESVFELFMQAERSSDGSYGGLGVGLSLVRRIVELHGGSVIARSEGRQKGTQFIVRLPRSASPSESADLTPPDTRSL